MLQTSTTARTGGWVTANNGERADIVLDSGKTIRLFRRCSIAPLPLEQFLAFLPIGRLAAADLELERISRARWDALNRGH